VDNFVEPDTKTYALYGRVTWKVASSTSLITGLRYNYDRLSYFDDERHYAANPVVSYGPLQNSGSNDSSALVGDLGLKFDLSRDSNVYATYTRGYAPHAHNTALAFVDTTPITPVGQGHVNNFEIGTKGVFLNHRLMFNFDIFYTIYRDYQIQSFSAAPGLCRATADTAECRQGHDARCRSGPRVGRFGYDACQPERLVRRREVRGLPQRAVLGWPWPAIGRLQPGSCNRAVHPGHLGRRNAEFAEVQGESGHRAALPARVGAGRSSPRRYVLVSRQRADAA
jgi:hypothetical protein